MKKYGKTMIIETLILLLLFWGYWSFCCVQRQTTYDEISTKIENGETFTLMIIKEDCNYCENLDTYIMKTKLLHPFHTIYVCTYDGAVNYPKELGYLSYTPSIFKIKNGDVVRKGVGFAPDGGMIAIDDGESNITKMDTMNFWEFLSSD